MGKIILISGPPGSGRRSVCNALCGTTKKYKVIRYDDYLLPQDKRAPAMTSTGQIIKIDESSNSLDLVNLNNDVISARFEKEDILLEGFIIRTENLNFIIDCHIHLSYVTSEKKEDIFLEKNQQIVHERILKAKSMHNFNSDATITREVLLSLYFSTLHNFVFSPTYIVPVYIGEKRIETRYICDRIKEILEDI